MKYKLEYNKLYQFRYKATTEGKIHVYDRTPLIFIIDIRKDNVLGVNLHWIYPKSKRLEFYDDVREIVENNKNNPKERERLTYALLQKPKYRIGLQAIRMYYHSGMTAIKELPEATWGLVLGYRMHRMRKVYKRTGYQE
jgi:hypothetical protein